MRRYIFFIILAFTTLAFVAACGSGNPGVGGISPAGKSQWTWMSGTNTINQPGSYGTKGSPAPTNMPGARYRAVSWVDSDGNLWFFGGYGTDANGVGGYFNDLWKFDGSNWTWMGGSNIINQPGTYGTKGSPAPTNMPGARDGAVCQIDKSGNLWLFGGYGYDTAGTGGVLNDLWKFDGNNWTWMGGSNTVNQAGTYGTKGAPAPTNMPGARVGAVSWLDRSGILWLFGGFGPDAIGKVGGTLNDLWKFDGSNWTWVSGANTINQAGTYGTKGSPAPANMPGARNEAVAWIDGSGNILLFGGMGYDATGMEGYLNDLWKFDGSNWTWVSGANTTDQAGIYGTKGIPAHTNMPGARWCAASWVDGNGNLWLFGGSAFGLLNDLWKFDGNNWTWVSGSDITDQTGTYGTKGTPASTNMPGARRDAISWIDGSGNFWLFGGNVPNFTDENGSYVEEPINDLWLYKP